MKNKENINIKLHYEKLFKYCNICGLMSHDAQDCLVKQNTAIQATSRETVFDRVRPNSNKSEQRGVDRDDQ